MTKKPDIHFEKEGHRYKINGIDSLSVTQAIQGVGMTDFSKVRPDILEASKKFGNAVHRMTELDDKNNLCEESLSGPLIPLLAGWRKFKKDYGIKKFLANEEKLGSLLFMYAGTPDRVAVIKSDIAIIDLKSTTTLYKTVKLQTAAYKQLWNENNPKRKAKRRLAVRLIPNNYRVNEFHDDSSDWRVFLACLQVTNFKLENNLIKF